MYRQQARLRYPIRLGGLSAIIGLSILTVFSRSALGGSLLVSWGAVQDSRVAGYKVKYGIASGSYSQNMGVGNVTSATLPGLTEGSTYYLVVVATDSAQVEGLPSAEVSGVVLKASSAASSSVTNNSAVITWQTNKASSSQVSYGTSTAYGSSSPLNSTLVTSHSVTLTGLSASTTYHYQVQSTDQGGSTSVLGDFTFATAAVAPPTISGVAGSGVTANAATITWTTSTASDSQVDYGTTTAYGSSTALNTAMVTSHSAGLSGLTAATTYHYRVKSKDAAGNLATSGDFTFTTTTTPSVLTVTSDSPKSGSPGTKVVIAGKGFGSTQGTSIVNFGSLTASATAWSDTSITSAVPANAPSGNVVITVTVKGNKSNGVNFKIKLSAPGQPHVN